MSMYAIGTQTNTGSMAAQRQLQRSTRAIHDSVGRLSSGLRVRSASDDSAAMAVSENMRAQLGGFRRAQTNVSDSVSMASTAESGYQAISDMLVRMKQLAVESASDAVTDTERGYAQVEFGDLVDEIDRLTLTLEYNGHVLLDGTAGSNSDGSITVQAGMRNSGNDQLALNLNSVNSTSLGLNASDVSTRAGAQLAIEEVDAGLETLNTERTGIGSFIVQASVALDYLAANVEQYTNGLGGQRDASLSEESATFNRQQVLQQAGVSMLAQAHAQANVALRLIG
jgi:flagellin